MDQITERRDLRRLSIYSELGLIKTDISFTNERERELLKHHLEKKEHNIQRDVVLKVIEWITPSLSQDKTSIVGQDRWNKIYDIMLDHHEIVDPVWDFLTEKSHTQAVRRLNETYRNKVLDDFNQFFNNIQLGRLSNEKKFIIATQLLKKLELCALEIQEDYNEHSDQFSLSVDEIIDYVSKMEDSLEILLNDKPIAFDPKLLKRNHPLIVIESLRKILYNLAADLERGTAETKLKHAFQIEEHMRVIQQLENKIASLKQENQCLQRKNTELQLKVDEHDEVIAEKDQIVAEKDKAIDCILNKFDEMMKVMDSRDIESKRRELCYQKSLEDAHEREQDIKTELLNVTNKLENMNNEAIARDAETQRKIERLREDVTLQEERLQQGLKESNDATHRNIEELENTMITKHKDIQHQNEEINKNLISQNIEMVETRNQMVQLRSGINDSQQMVHQLQQDSAARDKKVQHELENSRKATKAISIKVDKVAKDGKAMYSDVLCQVKVINNNLQQISRQNNQKKNDSPERNQSVKTRKVGNRNLSGIGEISNH